ncbi:hypothetical protein H2248_011372 [Termitomyces sp. 'cryptogamus']|nr:hypothetical protein H2248_011372 [Termitomyces sp. 'cryptogamus']
MLCLEEIEGIHASAKEVAKKHAFASCAIEAMDKEFKNAVKQLPKVIAIKNEIDATWDLYLQGYIASAKTYSHTL